MIKLDFVLMLLQVVRLFYFKIYFKVSFNVRLNRRTFFCCVSLSVVFPFFSLGVFVYVCISSINSRKVKPDLRETQYIFSVVSLHKIFIFITETFLLF